jgi:hypothetical protein
MTCDACPIVTDNRQGASLRRQPLALVSPGKRFEARLGVGGRKAPRLIEGTNPISKVGPVRTRGLQRFIRDVEGEDLFLFSPQGIHGIDPFGFATTGEAKLALVHE